jgi:hypothetical protein
VEAADFDLSEMNEQGGEELVRTSNEAARGGDELGVGEPSR